MAVLDLGRVVGPQGPQGATGAQGVRGEQGLPGPNQVTNQTATPLTGVLVGDGSVVGVRTIDSTPTADSTGIPTSGGVKSALDGKVPVYGMGKNLLRNWDFSVNQRGITSESNSGSAVYTRSGWKNGRCSYTFNENGTITYAALSGEYNAFLIQYIPDDLRTRQITLSAIIDGTLYSKTFTPSADYESSLGGGVNFRFAYYSSGTHIGTEIQFKHTSQSGITVGYPKLELGTEQTLCHNEGTEANPVWVLNEVPDYEYELYRCITSTADSSDTYANKSLANEQELAKVLHDPAGQNVAVGEYAIYNGQLYTANTAITSSMAASTFASYLTAENNGGFNGLLTKILNPDIITRKITCLVSNNSITIVKGGNFSKYRSPILCVYSDQQGNTVIFTMYLSGTNTPVIRMVLGTATLTAEYSGDDIIVTGIGNWGTGFAIGQRG